MAALHPLPQIRIGHVLEREGKLLEARWVMTPALIPITAASAWTAILPLNVPSVITSLVSRCSSPSMPTARAAREASCRWSTGI